MKRFLLCFSPEDADGKAELTAHLSAVSETLTTWSVDEVPAGESLAHEFRQAAASVDAALLLLSADFFAALSVQSFAEQIAQLRHQHTVRGLLLIPLLWRDCGWQAASWLTELNPLPHDGNALRSLSRRRRDKAFAEIARRLGEQKNSREEFVRIGVCSRLRRWLLLSLLLFASVLVAAVNFVTVRRSNSGSAPSDAAVLDFHAASNLWKVEGIVRDARQHPLMGVTVSLPELDATTETNAQGHFRFAVSTDHDGLVLLRAEKRAVVLSRDLIPRPTEVHVSMGSTKLNVILEDE